MKKKILLLLFLIIVFDSFSFTLNDSLKIRLNSFQPHHVTVKTNPLTVLWGCIPFTSEFKLISEFTILPHQSIQVGFSYLGKGWPLLIAENASNRQSGRNSALNFYSRGYRFQYFHRFYLKNKISNSNFNFAPNGFYHGPMISYASAKIGLKNNGYGNYYLVASNTQLCWISGFQNIIDDGFLFDLYFGLGYKNNVLNEYNRKRGVRVFSTKDIPFYGNNFKIILGFNIGWAFK